MTQGVALAGGHSGAIVEALRLPDEFDALRAAATRVLALTAEADAWDAGLRRRALAELEKVANALTVAKSRVIGAERQAGTWSLQGDRDLAGFVGRESHQGRGAGLAAVGQALTLAALPVVAEAMVDGPVTPRHVDEITRATGASPRLAAELAAPEGQARVVELARRLDGQEFGRHLRRMSAALDPASRQREHDRQRAERYLNISHLPGGTLVKVQLDSVSGHRFAKAIEAHDPRPGGGDDRPAAQCRADSLMVMVDRSLADDRTPPGAVAPVQALITVSEETWTALRAGREGGAGDPVVEAPETRAAEAGFAPTAAPGRGSAADLVDRLRGMPAVVDETGQAWPASEVGRALCDCALTRAVLDADGAVLDLGRSRRLFGRRHWVALYASGQTTCSVAGCSMPLRYCELHHVRWWDRDCGPTDLANCAPMCAFHHAETHRLDLRITRRPDGCYEHRHPDGRRYGGTLPTADPPDADGDGGGVAGTAMSTVGPSPNDRSRLLVWPSAGCRPPAESPPRPA